MSVEEAYRALYSGALIVTAVLLCVMLIRAVIGPGVTDRVLSINMIGTLIVAAIVILSSLLSESWLLDVALIYTMTSLVSVLILARVYIPPRPKRKPFADDADNREGDGQTRGESSIRPRESAAHTGTVNTGEEQSEHA